MRVLGIDPGIAGACVLIKDGEVIAVADMPVVTARGKRRVCPAQLAALLASWCPIEHCMIEAASARPGQGVSSMFGYGRSYGVVLGVLSALGISFTEVSAVSWKRTLAVPSDKDAARARAGQLLPAAAKHWPLQRHHGRAEAALLGLLALRSAA
jgi:crossover junction endodeoxyribonuclease RuvC